MPDVLAALIPPGVMAGVIITFVVWLFRTQRTNKPEHEDDDQIVRDDTNR